jgi:Spx/MgsR family transcriptional regulator
MPITVYGIKNCDTMKKARAWLDKHGVAYEFHDYKTRGVDKERLEGWANKAGWEVLLNKSGTTFKKLPEKDKEGLNDQADAGAALDDQAAGAGACARQASGRVQARGVSKRL